MSDVEVRRRFFEPSTVETLFGWFQRLVAGYCLLFGVIYWVRLIGYYDQTLWRFDLMPVPWQIASVALSALFPFAAIGLWMLASWGPVIWFLCAVMECVMYLWFHDIFGRNLVVPATHIFAAVLYAVFRVVIHLQKKAAKDPI